jgi:ABC-type nickel/cobalt efflux system permease component RcnA
VAAGAIVGATILGLNAKSNVAAVLAFTAAVLVALLTAYWTQRRLSQELRAADRRQVRQLDAENARQAQQLEAENLRHAQALDAERQRLELQLAHDRRLHDLEELRETARCHRYGFGDRRSGIPRLRTRRTTHCIRPTALHPSVGNTSGPSSHHRVAISATQHPRHERRNRRAPRREHGAVNAINQ